MAQVTSGTLNTGSYDGRYYQLTWEAAQSTTNNTSTISWSLKAVGGADTWYAERTLKVVIAGHTVVNKTDRVERYTGVVASGTLPAITHDSAGNKSFSASIQAAVYVSTVNCTGSGSWELKQIPRKANLTAAPNFNDEANPTITYSNPAGNSVTSLQACIADSNGSTIYVPYRNISKTGTSYTFNLTDAERNTLRKAFTTSNSGTVKFYVQTVIGETTYRSSLAKTLTIVNANPTISASAKDVGSVSVTITGDANKMIKGYNAISVSMTATALKGATIKSYKITNGDKTLTTSSGSFNYTDNNKFVFSATDSRGNTTSKTITLTMINYVKLTCNLNAENPTADGSMSFTISGNYFKGSLGAVDNTLAVEYRYKLASAASYGATWTALTPTISGSTYSATGNITGLDYKTKYTLQVRAIDKVNPNGVYAPQKTVKASPVFDWSEDDFNLNVSLKMNNKTVLRELEDLNHTVLSANGGNIYFRPDNTTTNQMILTTGGKLSAPSLSVDGRMYGENVELWSGAYYMTANQTITLPSAVSAQPHGIVLVFSDYDIENSKASDYDWHSFFIPKKLVELKSGTGHGFNMMSQGFGAITSKYIYIRDTTISGNDVNTTSGTRNGITYNNAKYVLRYVFGV